MTATIRQLSARVEQLEHSRRRLGFALFAVAAVAISCGAASTTAQFKKVSTHTLAVFGAGESGEVIRLGRTTEGGQMILEDAKGHQRVQIGVDGVTVLDDAGKLVWQSDR